MTGILCQSNREYISKQGRWGRVLISSLAFFQAPLSNINGSFFSWVLGVTSMVCAAYLEVSDVPPVGYASGALWKGYSPSLLLPKE